MKTYCDFQKFLSGLLKLGLLDNSEVIQRKIDMICLR